MKPRTLQLAACMALVICSVSPAAAQGLFGKNLVVNGDAEAGPASSPGTPPNSIPGWTITGAPNVIAYSANDRLTNRSLGPANRNNNYFAGSNTAKGVLSQKIDLSAAATSIDAGSVSFDASGYLGGESGDTSSMTVTFLNAAGATASSFTLGPVTEEDRAGSGLYLRRKIGQLPAGTRAVNVEIDLIRSSGSANDGCADNIVFSIKDATALPAGFFGSNVIVNGNAEAPSGTQLPVPLSSVSGTAVLDLPGWVRSARFTLDAYSDSSDLSATDPGPSDRGSWYFYGGSGNASSNATQDIDVSAAAAQIDKGAVTFAFSAWIGGIAGQNDNMTITADFLNWSGTVLSTSTLGPVRDADRGGKDALLLQQQSGGVPAGTRVIRITMASVRTDGSDNDGLADSLSMVLSVPGAGGSAPSVQSNGVVSASAFGGFSSIAPGTWIEIYGSNLAGSSREWAGSDFRGTAAPTSLDGTGVTIGGQQAFIRYISPTQVNVQVPSNVTPGQQQLTVTTANGSSTPYPVTVSAAQPGLLAPPVFVVGGKQYVVALHSDGSFVLPPGVIPGVQSRQAKPDETILLYGIGFGPVTPAFDAGLIVNAANQLSQPLQIQFGQASATLSYAGLAPNFIGLYQFNVVVPNVADNDLTPLTFNLGGTAGSQTLYIAVKR